MHRENPRLGTSQREERRCILPADLLACLVGLSPQFTEKGPILLGRQQGHIIEAGQVGGQPLGSLHADGLTGNRLDRRETARSGPTGRDPTASVACPTFAYNHPTSRSTVQRTTTIERYAAKGVSISEASPDSGFKHHEMIRIDWTAPSTQFPGGLIPTIARHPGKGPVRPARGNSKVGFRSLGVAPPMVRYLRRPARTRGRSSPRSRKPASTPGPGPPV
jgi:hypothetical protein